MKKRISRFLHTSPVFDIINLTIPRRFNGKRFRIPVIKSMGWENVFMPEMWMVELLEKILPLRDGSFIDVGANVGQTLLKLRSVSGTTEYIGFEPNPVCFFYLKELMQANMLGNVRLFPVGISNRCGFADLNLYSDSPVDSSATMVSDFRPAQPVFRRMAVPINTAESIECIATIPRISIIKIDVEGGELDVIESFSGSIKKHRPFLLIEILPVYDEKNRARKDRQEAIEKQIAGFHYDLFRVEKSPQDTLRGLSKITSIGIHGDLTKCDYLCVPKETAVTL